MGHHLACPDCGKQLKPRLASRTDPLLQLEDTQCQNAFCSSAFIVSRRITHRMNVGNQVNPVINLPLAAAAERQRETAEASERQEDWIGELPKNEPIASWPKRCGKTATESRISRHLCPDCGELCQVRNSHSDHPLLRSEYIECLNPECGSSFRGEREITYRLGGSYVFTSQLNIPVAPEQLVIQLRNQVFATPQMDWVNQSIAEENSYE